MPSTVIDTYHYDPVLKILQVVFLSGAVYNYLQVPPPVYEEMKQAFSKGTYFNERVKNNYRFKKIK